MRLSEERVAVLARLITERLLDEELVDLELGERDFRFMIENLILRDLKIEDEIDEEATTFLLQHKPNLEEGSTGWDLELERKKEEFSIARGYIAF
ncbi:hypothetical protein DRQ50_04740 [bacterium]|nr:MAG: hypothetical protein DRQ50_04740 [bacterium]